MTGVQTCALPILQSIGKTAEGREQLMAIITAPENFKKLDRYKEIARKLATVDGLTDDQARALAKEGKAIVWIDGGLHATEVLGAQQLIETIWQFNSKTDEETMRILRDTIILATHVNPDGMELVSDWYMRNPNPQQRSTAQVPRLYQKYVGHDNNRDFYMMNQPESVNINRQLYREWFPQIVYNHHQTGPTGTMFKTETRYLQRSTDYRQVLGKIVRDHLGGIHAMKWSGSNSSYVDLQPSGYNFSYCTGVDGNDQGGFAEQQSYAVTASHAMLWHGNSLATDLHPISFGMLFSRVMGVKAGEEAGYVSNIAYPVGDYLGYHTSSKAVVWHGTPDSAVNLHPLGYDSSEALATNGTQQGGWAYRLVDNATHAMLWNGTADTAVDLHPAGYTATKINEIGRAHV